MLITALLYVFFFSRYGAHRDLPSFPTRRSSDLIVAWRAKLHRSRTRTAPRLTPAQRLAGCEESGPGRRLLAVFPARQRSEIDGLERIDARGDRGLPGTRASSVWLRLESAACDQGRAREEGPAQVLYHRLPRLRG